MKEDNEDLFDGELLDRYRQYMDEEERGAMHSYYDADEYASFISMCFVEDDMEKAAQILSEALERFPMSMEVRLKQAELSLETGFPQEALSIVEDIERQNPCVCDVQITKAHILKELCRYNQALQTLEKAREYGAHETDIHIAAGLVYLEMNQNEKAWQHGSRILCGDDDSVEEANAFIDIATESFHLKEAMDCVDKLIAQFPYKILYWRTLSELQEADKNYEKALEAEDYILAIDPDNDQAWIHKFRLMEYVDNSETRLDFYKDFYKYASVKQLDILPDLIMRTGQEYEISGDYDHAEPFYQNCLSFTRVRRYALFRLGVIEHFRFSYTTAMNYFTRALECDGGDLRSMVDLALVYRGIARNYYYHGNSTKYLEFAAKAVETDIENAQHALALVSDSMSLGIESLALDYFKTKREGYSFMRLCRGILEYRCGNKEEGLKYMASAFTDPNARWFADSRFAALYETEPDIKELRNAFMPEYTENQYAMAEARAQDEFFGPLPDRYKA